MLIKRFPKFEKVGCVTSASISSYLALRMYHFRVLLYPLEKMTEWEALYVGYHV